MRDRQARRSSSCARPASVADRDPRGARERRRVGRRHRRLDERRPPPLAIARELGIAVRARRLRSHRGAHSDRRRPEAVGPLRRDRHLRCRRRRLVARELVKARARPRRRAERRRPHARARSRPTASSDRGQEVVVPIETPLKATRRPRDPARQPRSRGMRGEARRPRADGCTEARLASSTRRRSASRR